MIMTSFLNVPFLPEERYVAFLNDCAEDLYSVHFSLQHQHSLDSRTQVVPAIEHSWLMDRLGQLLGPKKYALLNSRFYSPQLLADGLGLRALIDTLAQFVEHGVLHGIVYCDHYLLQLLADEAPGLAARLEAAPSVNTMLDSFDKIEAQLSYIRATGFAQPSTIVLDRSLNRNLDSLAQIALQTRQQFPGIRIEVLANEGCLPFCPFKLSHDAYIALANLDGCDRTQALNCEIGCMRLLDDQPHRLLQSPFIRPEDIDLYLFHVDTIKLCGRTLGPDFLMNAIRAYRARRYEGNLLDLLDATAWLADKLYVDNRLLSFDFANMLSQCDNRCEQCGFCRELFASIAHPLSLSIQDRRPQAD